MWSMAAYAIGPKEALKEAYASLAVANHDYEGHRGNALDHIRNAAKSLGVSVEADARDHNERNDKDRESDRASDAHVRYARDMLDQARTALRDRRDKGKDVQHALKEIDAALQEVKAAMKVK